MAEAINLMVRLHSTEYERLKRLSERTGATRSKLLRVGLASLWQRDPDALAFEAAALHDGRARVKSPSKTSKSDGRPAANGTTAQVAEQERRDDKATAIC